MLDLLVIIIYFGGVTLAGLYFATRNKDTEQYFLGGRNFPGWAIGISMVGTSISAMSFLGNPGEAYKRTWLLLLGSFTLPIAVLLGAYVFMPFYRRFKVTSAFEYLEMRFGAFTRGYGAWMFIAGQLFRNSVILFLVSVTVQTFTGWDMSVCIILSGVFVAFYTVAGGIEAVVWTDVVQTIVLVFGGIACLVVIVMKLEGGLGQILSEGYAAQKFSFSEWVQVVNADGVKEAVIKPASWDFSITKKTAMMILFVGMINWLFEYSGNQNVVQRYCAASSMKEARKAMLICCITSIPIWVFFNFIGTSLWVYYQNNPVVEAAQMLDGTKSPEHILPFFVLNNFPAGLAGLVVAAVLAAAMSSLDSSLNASTTVFITDVYRRHLVKGKSEKHYLSAARWTAIVASVFMIVGAFFIHYSGKTDSILDMGTVVAAITLSGILSIFLLGFFTKVNSAAGIGTGIAVTMVFTIYRALAGFDWFPIEFMWLDKVDGYYTAIFGNIIMFVIGFVLGQFLPSKEKRDLTNLTVWTTDGLNWEDEEAEEKAKEA